MSRPWSQYRKVVVETYRGPLRGTHGDIRVRPVSGEFFPTTIDVECSKTMRHQHPVGTKFRIYAKETCREGGESFLYTHFKWPYEIVEG